MSEEIVARLRQVQESTYGLSESLTQIRKLAGLAADHIIRLEEREKAIKSAIAVIKD